MSEADYPRERSYVTPTGDLVQEFEWSPDVWHQSVLYGSEKESSVIKYDREVLVQVVIYHGRDRIEGCHCGWRELGKSHAEHVADAYEARVAAPRAKPLPYSQVEPQPFPDSMKIKLRPDGHLLLNDKASSLPVPLNQAVRVWVSEDGAVEWAPVED